MGRRALTATTMTVLVILLAVAAFYGYRAISRPMDEPDSTSDPHGNRSCDDGLKKGDIVRAREVTVSVFNAGTITGLAAQTQDQLAARKFIRGDIANAPAGFNDVRLVRVLAPKPVDPAAKLVALQFGPSTRIEVTHKNLGPGVDVVVGNEFVGLAKAAPSQVRATASGSGC